jgi:putative ABC transport system permease protein
VKTWRQLNELLVMVDDYVGAVMIVLYLVVLAVTATVVVNTLIMSVFERTREIGVLSAIGMKANSILSLFLAESAMLAVGGIVIGLVLGGILVVYFSINGFYFGALTKGINMLLSDIIYADLTLKDTIVLTITALVVTLLASLYPASLAAQMEPVDALRGGK